MCHYNKDITVFTEEVRMSLWKKIVGLADKINDTMIKANESWVDREVVENMHEESIDRALDGKTCKNCKYCEKKYNWFGADKYYCTLHGNDLGNDDSGYYSIYDGRHWSVMSSCDEYCGSIWE